MSINYTKNHQLPYNHEIAIRMHMALNKLEPACPILADDHRHQYVPKLSPEENKSAWYCITKDPFYRDEDTILGYYGFDDTPQQYTFAYPKSKFKAESILNEF